MQDLPRIPIRPWTNSWAGRARRRTPRLDVQGTAYRLATCVTHIRDELREIGRVLGQADVLVGFLVVVPELQVFVRSRAARQPSLAVKKASHLLAERAGAASRLPTHSIQRLALTWMVT